MRTAAAATTAVVEAATASAPDSLRSNGRPQRGAAVARTEELYARHGRLVSGLCRALLRDRAEAEDAAQQTFLAAHRALVNGTTPREPAAWLATIARNECWARIRSRMREPLPTEEIDASGGTDPLSEAIRRADLAALWKAIGDLPRQQRDAFLLREFSGLTYGELAEALAVTGPAVESLLFRARQGLRARLETAYAAVSGVSIVESLARLLAGASSSTAPAVVKAVAAAGVGAAFATGGVVVAPYVLEHHREPLVHRAQLVHAPLAAHPVAVPTTAVAATIAASLRHGTGSSVLRLQDSHHGGRDAGGRDAGGRSGGDGEDAHAGRTAGSGEDDRPATSATAQRAVEGGRGGDSGEPSSLSETGDAQAGDSGSGDAGSGGDGGGSGQDGSGGHGAQQPSDGGGGLTLPLPNPPVTVNPTPVDPAPGSDN